MPDHGNVKAPWPTGSEHEAGGGHDGLLRPLESLPVPKPVADTTAAAIGAKDLALILALVRSRSLADAARRLGVDSSSVYRSLKQLEKSLRLTLFDRSPKGIVPGELALRLAERAEAIETQLSAAREMLVDDHSGVHGQLRVTSNDVMLSYLLMPLVAEFRRQHPRLEMQLLQSNALARLDRREADVALRGTRQPPPHLVGVRLGTVKSALWGLRTFLQAQDAGSDPSRLTWATPDAESALGDHPSRRWRMKTYPQACVGVRCEGILSVVNAIRCGAAIGVAPYFAMQGDDQLVDLSGHLPEVDIDLWLLTHPDMRHLRHVKAFFDFVRARLRLP